MYCICKEFMMRQGVLVSFVHSVKSFAQVKVFVKDDIV